DAQKLPSCWRCGYLGVFTAADGEAAECPVQGEKQAPGRCRGMHSVLHAGWSQPTGYIRSEGRSVDAQGLRHPHDQAGAADAGWSAAQAEPTRGQVLSDSIARIVGGGPWAGN